MKDKILKKIQENYLKFRRTGVTSWLIKNLLVNPNVIVICPNAMRRDDLKQRWETAMRVTTPKIDGNYSGIPKPEFLSILNMPEEFNPNNFPVIFDTSVISCLTEN